MKRTFEGMGTFEGTVLRYRPIKKVFELRFYMKGNGAEDLEPDPVSPEELKKYLVPEDDEGGGESVEDDSEGEGEAGNDTDDGDGDGKGEGEQPRRAEPSEDD